MAAVTLQSYPSIRHALSQWSCRGKIRTGFLESWQKREVRLTFKGLGKSARLASRKVISKLEHDDKTEWIQTKHHLPSGLFLKSSFKVDQPSSQQYKIKWRCSTDCPTSMYLTEIPSTGHFKRNYKIQWVTKRPSSNRFQPRWGVDLLL